MNSSNRWRIALGLLVATAAACSSNGMANDPDASREGGAADASTDGRGDACAPGDEPDPANVDSNCDGVDGDVAAAVFVSPSGDDTNPGTREAPVHTLHAGLALAARSSRTQVLLAAGSYSETATVELVDGVGIYGGYQPANHWSRGTGSSTIIGAQLALDASGIRSRTVLARVAVVAADAVDSGNSSIALRAVDSPGLVVNDATSLTAGQGAAGAPGSAGAVGASGADGSDGRNGAVDNQDAPGAGGLSGRNDLCREANGGDGGSGGQNTTNFVGQPGRASVAGEAGGAPGSTSSCTGQDGSAGEGSPNAGAAGDPGAGGSASGAIDPTSNAYLPASGSLGTAGSAGHGGGGGGGSSGQTGSFCSDGSGNGGGGGGAGGCGGASGTAGGGGGASIAVLCVRSGITLQGIVLATQNGGIGGAGGAGGAGGNAGSGGAGATVGTSEIGSGGRGGDGAAGGAGGAGGGGGGGPSVGIWTVGSVVNATDVTFDLGMGGAGGGSPGGTISRGGQGIRAEMAP